MKECCATYKVGIRFTNFYKNDGTYWDYPFVDPSDSAMPVGVKTMNWLENYYLIVSTSQPLVCPCNQWQYMVDGV